MTFWTMSEVLNAKRTERRDSPIFTSAALPAKVAFLKISFPSRTVHWKLLRAARRLRKARLLSLRWRM